MSTLFEWMFNKYALNLITVMKFTAEILIQPLEILNVLFLIVHFSHSSWGKHFKLEI